MSNHVLELKHIQRNYTQGGNVLRVLNDINLTMNAGEMLALVGPSGSGKSTLLQVAGLLDTPQAGEIYIGGQAVHHASDAKRTELRNLHIGFIYQFHHLLPELTALENVVLPQRIAGISQAAAVGRAAALLERLGLKDRLTHLPAQMSGGEQQRVAIARALANRPQLILADEPTGNLDPATSENVVQLLLEIARDEKIAAMIATHNMAFARRLHRAVSVVHGTLEPVTL
jgi:lipoprotein-releasing system ATP-binding protein